MAAGDEVVFPAGAAVRVVTLAGPYIPATVLRRNRTTYTVAFHGGSHREPHSQVHDTPCLCCTDHPRTQYPHGT